MASDAYIAAVYRPDLTFSLNSIAQVTQPTKTDVAELSKAIPYALATKHQVLKFVALDVSTPFIAVIIDASFANNSDRSSQFGVLINLTDEQQNCNVIHYTSSKSQRIARSALEAQLFALVNGFDPVCTLRLAINNILNRQVPLKLFTDSKSLFDGIVGLNFTNEKRLLIDLQMLRQAYE